ncbi:small integral membrane protein 26 isoform X2 [Pteropus alecto]|uniref:Small integral membrane protein 26-like isoform X2 n=1 Tax=Pteropus vampyrus TaxID=132908 RepID=A0A6P6D2J6_PTEVA|nr:small integral membrane protein 26-like isoform X2 [Pteropus vampyrus]XP_024895587.1 small integral membrane protein 26 isoform X2 [Pteropus alecto]
MRPDQAVIWYRRMSAVYALGAWTLLGSLFFLGGKKSKLSGDEVEQKDVSTNEIPEQKMPLIKYLIACIRGLTLGAHQHHLLLK